MTWLEAVYSMEVEEVILKVFNLIMKVSIRVIDITVLLFLWLVKGIYLINIDTRKFQKLSGLIGLD